MLIGGVFNGVRAEPAKATGAGLLVSMTMKSDESPSRNDFIFLTGGLRRFDGGLARLLDLNF